MNELVQKDAKEKAESSEGRTSFYPTTLTCALESKTKKRN